MSIYLYMAGTTTRTRWMMVHAADELLEDQAGSRTSRSIDDKCNRFVLCSGNIADANAIRDDETKADILSIFFSQLALVKHMHLAFFFFSFYIWSVQR